VNENFSSKIEFVKELNVIQAILIVIIPVKGVCFLYFVGLLGFSCSDVQHLCGWFNFLCYQVRVGICVKIA